MQSTVELRKVYRLEKHDFSSELNSFQICFFKKEPPLIIFSQATIVNGSFLMSNLSLNPSTKTLAMAGEIVAPTAVVIRSASTIARTTSSRCVELFVA